MGIYLNVFGKVYLEEFLYQIIGLKIMVEIDIRKRL